MEENQNLMKKIQELIGRARLKEALEALRDATPSHLETQVIQLQGRLSTLERNERMGVLSFSEASIERSKISNAALELCNEATSSETITESDTGREEGAASPSPSKTETSEGQELPLPGKKIFFSYSKHDREFLEQLKRHMAGLRRLEKIKSWDDHDILPGEDWNETVKRELAAADIILLLVSSDFLATEYIWNVEITAAMARHERGEARVIPISLRPCSWKGTPFAKLNGLPSKAKPVSSYADLDQAWVEVVEGIERVIAFLNNK